jgi:predicted ferric reductase
MNPATTAQHDRGLRGLSGISLPGLYVVVALSPLLLASLAGKPARNFWRELSAGLAMLGFAMLMLEFVLSGRFGRLSGRVGIDVTMRVHQLAALGILLFLFMKLDLQLVLSEPSPEWRGLSGELSAGTLAACLGEAWRQRWTYFVCGPPAMMNSVEHSLLHFGVPGRQIIAERFKYD